MRYALISDVHSNLEALEAVIDAIRRESADECISLGDIVGYAADPNQCIRLIKDFAGISLLGNHDSAAVGATGVDGFNPLAKAAVLWTREQLTPENRDYIESLATTVELEKSFLVHSSPSDPSVWRYIFSVDDARMEFQHFSQFICFVGHSHQPLTFVQSKDRVIVDTRTAVDIERGNRYIVNVGSVGQPRDLDPRATYAIYDTDENAIRIERIQYDVPSARRKIIQAGLPHFLGDRLVVGR